MADKITPPSTQLIGRTLALRNTNSPWTIAVRSGIAPHSESAAFGAVSNYMHDLNAAQRTGLIRAAGIAATYRNARQVGGSFGHGLRRLHYAHYGNWPDENNLGSGIGSDLRLIVSLGVEHAARTFSTLVGRCEVLGVGVNFHSLSDLLIGWGTIPTNSVFVHRNQVLNDFFMPRIPKEN